jgi:undecaprenyl-diphosphatase
MFFVVIQLGAILAVLVLFWNKLWPFARGNDRAHADRTVKLWFKVIIGAIPAAIMGLLFDDLLEKYLYTPIVISAALIIYGIAFILIERHRTKEGRSFRINNVYDLTYKDALLIGAYQVLSLVPGTSRSGSTILGGMLSGVNRSASAEFSFFMAIPIMVGASGYKILKFIIEGNSITNDELILLLVGIAVSFAVSLAVIRFLMDFVKKHSFSAFGIYRIILGALLIGYFLVKVTA